MHAHHTQADPNRPALTATLHCLTGCALGEVAGMAIATALAWGNAASIALSILLAFVFGYALTLWPVLRAGVGFRRASGIVVASETVSISIMEAIDNLFVVLVPGALAAGLGDAKFWWSIAAGFAIAFGPTFLANRWLIARGRGHAVLHELH
jgi:hypothetical protein